MKTLVEHFFDFIKKTPNVDINYLLHIGMGDPNVILKFQLLMNADVFTIINKLFLDIQNSIRKGVAALNFDVDQYALDIQFFFK